MSQNCSFFLRRHCNFKVTSASARLPATSAQNVQLAKADLEIALTVSELLLQDRIVEKRVHEDQVHQNYYHHRQPSSTHGTHEYVSLVYVYHML
jgi:hypothetical protein